MGQRNMLCTRQMLDMEIEQGQSHLHPDPCIVVGNIVDFQNPNIHPVLSASGNTANLDLRNLQGHHDSNIFYGNQYNNLQHRHPIANLDLAGGVPSNFSYNSYMIPSSTSRICPIPLHHGSFDNVPPSSNHGIIGVTVDEYGRNDHFIDNVRGSCKRKNAEGVSGNLHYVNGSASSSSSSLNVSLNSGLQQWEETFEPGVGVLDATAFTPSEYRGSGVLSITEGSQRSVRSRSNAIGLQMDSALSNHHNQLLPGNYMGQSFQPPNNVWVEQLGNNGGDGGSSNWNYAPSMPYLHGRSVNGGPVEIGRIGGQHYQDTTSSRNSAILLHPPMHHHHQHQHQHPHHHHQPPMQGMRGGHNYSYHPQIPAHSYRHPMNLHQSILNPSQDGMDPGFRYLRPFPSSSDRIYRPHRRVPQAAPEDSNGRMRFLSSEDVALLEFSGFYGVGNFIDQHRDMRLDIDNMSYEELLALEERIGDVNTGLSEESILKSLKTRIHVSCAASSSMDKSAGMAQERETCIICQVEYEDEDKIGTLECEHNFHVDCIRQWLLVKSICPICKKSASSVDKREG